LTVNQLVVGSIPTAGAKNPKKSGYLPRTRHTKSLRPDDLGNTGGTVWWFATHPSTSRILIIARMKICRIQSQNECCNRSVSAVRAFFQVWI
jgi:hypothetical protein